jgi:hypothetical protein
LAFYGIAQGLAGLYDQNLWLLRVKLRRTTLHTVFMPYVVDGALSLTTCCRFSQEGREANRTSFEARPKERIRRPICNPLSLCKTHGDEHHCQDREWLVTQRELVEAIRVHERAVRYRKQRKTGRPQHTLALTGNSAAGEYNHSTY